MGASSSSSLNPSSHHIFSGSSGAVDIGSLVEDRGSRVDVVEVVGLADRVK